MAQSVCAEIEAARIGTYCTTTNRLMNRQMGGGCFWNRKQSYTI